MPLTAKIALRFLTFSLGQTVMVIAGISIGFAVQIFVGLLINSVQNNIITSTLGSIPHITIESATDDELIDSPEKIISYLDNIKGITKVEEVAQRPALVRGETQNFPVVFRGLDTNTKDLFQIRQNIVAGHFFRNEREIVIGSELLSELEIELGESVVLLNKEDSIILKVVGIYESGITALDKTLIVGDITTARDFFGLRQKATSIEIQVDDLLNADVFKDELARILPISRNYTFSDWQKENQLLKNALSSQDTSNIIIQLAILSSLVVAITSILSITVLQKSKQIGILKAMGFTNKETQSVFLISSFLLGIMGASIGLALGFAMYLTFVSKNLDTNGLPIFEPVVNWVYVALSWSIAVTMATFAGIIPARRSAELDPIDIIQNG